MREVHERKRDLQLLELADSATLEEIEQGYRRMFRRYGAGRFASYGLFRMAERQKFLAALKEAFARLLRDEGIDPMLHLTGNVASFGGTSKGAD